MIRKFFQRNQGTQKNDLLWIEFLLNLTFNAFFTLLSPVLLFQHSSFLTMVPDYQHHLEHVRNLNSLAVSQTSWIRSIRAVPSTLCAHNPIVTHTQFWRMHKFALPGTFTSISLSTLFRPFIFLHPVNIQNTHLWGRISQSDYVSQQSCHAQK